MDLYVQVSGEMAARILAAENEHDDDFRYAKTQILDAADAAIPAFLDGKSYGPADSEEDAQGLADAALNTHLQDALSLTGVEDFEWANIASYYVRAANMTGKRDDSAWHDFGHETRVEANRVVHEITTGDTEIGTHPAADVIKLDELT
jgi:hypothetical protein